MTAQVAGDCEKEEEESNEARTNPISTIGSTNVERENFPGVVAIKIPWTSTGGACGREMDGNPRHPTDRPEWARGLQTWPEVQITPSQL